ncbi:MAG TPA: ABC transporter substrate-binding protein [Candidatus Acidoferrales bacterium]|nr:ABC transporter substrate-binding protein [Candidatus Acidoferrales bacterium]
MKKFFSFLIVIVVLLIAAGSYFLWNKLHNQAKIADNLTPFTVVLDWTPNTNHTGMYVALAKGWYKEQGLNVKILPYASGTSPEVLVASGKADVAVSSTEGVVQAAASGNPVVSIAAIIQHNTSGFIARSDGGITRPRDLDNKIDGDSDTPIESAILHAIITKDGGKGTFKHANLDVDSMQALANKKIDFFWAFEGWEVVQAKQQGIPVVYFPSLTYGIPDYYTPVLVASPTEIQQKPELLKKFMIATSRGYTYAIQHPKEAANILIATTPKDTFPDKGFIQKSQAFLSAHYVDRGRVWGLQDKKEWQEYPQFMISAGAVLDKNGKPVKTLPFDSLYTNKFVQ